MAAAVVGNRFAFAQPDGTQRWTYASEGSSAKPRILSSPAFAADGTVYFSITFDIPGQAFGAVIALNPNAAGGPAEKWRFQIPEYVDSSPVVGPDGTVYIGWGDGRLYALNKDNGKPIWTFDANKLSTDPAYFHSTPAISRDGSTLYVGVGEFGISGPTSGSICAVSTTNGTLVWRTTTTQTVESSPAIGDDGTVYIGGWDSNVYALNPNNGAEKWHHQLDGPIFASPAIGGDGTIYIGSTASTFIALTPDHQVRWQRSLTVPGSAAIGADGTVYVGNLGDGRLYALNPNDGSTKWTAIGQPSADSTPVVRADGIVLFGSDDDIMRAYDPVQDGAIKWSITTKGHLSSSPAISPIDNTIYFGSGDGLLYSVQGNASGLSQYSSWPMFQHDVVHTGRALPRAVGGRLVNLATRGLIGGGHSLVAGFVIKDANKQLLVRGVGPTLRRFLVNSAANNPTLVIRNTVSFIWAQNDDWSTSPDATLIADTAAGSGAFPLDAGSKDAALVTQFVVGLNYSAYVESADGSPGVALAEIYDADGPNVVGQLVNLSTRGFVGTGENVLIPGFVIDGPGRLRVLVRAVGPGLTPLGVPGVVAQPVMSVYSQSTGQLIGTNAGWTAGGLKGDLTGAAALSGAFPLKDTDSDAAMILALDPGGYTFLVSGANGGTGEALVEVYALPY